MPFAQREIKCRQDIPEIFDNTQNILSKITASNLIGLLNQFEQISIYACEVLQELSETTKTTGERIKSAQKRINNLETRLPNIETMLVSNAPNVFYDNPYSESEYLRNDALNSLLFFNREDASFIVNRRRNEGYPPTDLSRMDGIDPNRGPCIKLYSDSHFFMNEWLKNEKIKIGEERQRRQAVES